ALRRVPGRSPAAAARARHSLAGQRACGAAREVHAVCLAPRETRRGGRARLAETPAPAGRDRRVAGRAPLPSPRRPAAVRRAAQPLGVADERRLDAEEGEGAGRPVETPAGGLVEPVRGRVVPERPEDRVLPRLGELVLAAGEERAPRAVTPAARVD